MHLLLETCRYVAFSAILLAQSAQGADLAGDQREVADRYDRLKEAALRVAESADESAQTRAEQIRAAIRKSQELQVAERLSTVIQLLEGQRLAAAASGQGEIAQQLEELLRVLIEDPRELQLAAEQARLERLATELQVLVQRQQALRRATKRSRIERLADRQSGLADETAEARASSEGIESKQPDGPTIAQRLGEAEGAMREAADGMSRGGGNQIEEKQLEAQRAIESALREVEESLRQLREEEHQRRLASLADRLKGMHRGEIELHADTVEIHASNNPSSRSTRVKIASLAQRQSQLTEEASRAARLVEADDASLVFTEALQQIEHDMSVIARRLSQERIAISTQSLEQGVINALAEMIEAVDSTLSDIDRQRQSQQQHGSSNAESSLIARLAELRMLRAVQARIQSQTKTWHEIVEREGVMSEEARTEISRLANQQRKLSEASQHAASLE